MCTEEYHENKVGRLVLAATIRLREGSIEMCREVSVNQKKTEVKDASC
jgi:hypothetical protein